MIDDMRVLALIPARGGSKGIKGKNIIDLMGKPLISYSIIAGLESKYIDRVVVSTDSENIAKVAREYGADVPFMRPDYLASDTAKSIDAVIHAINWLKNNSEEYDILVLLQPTQPLREAIDIDNALECFIKNGKESLVSVKKVAEHPVLMRTIGAEGKLEKLLHINSTIRRQDMEDYYVVDGSIYINLVSELNTDTSLNDNVVPYIMDSNKSVDIDEMMDLIIAEGMMKYNSQEYANDIGKQ